jgi:hypothetical protein
MLTGKNITEKDTKDEGISLAAPVIMELIEAVHEKGASFRFQARGYSMTPAIRDGDFITISPLRDFIPGRGDVLAFRHSNGLQLLVHRVLKKNKNRFLIKGDNCPEADGWVPLENILGLITRVERQEKNRFWPNRSEYPLCSVIYLFTYPFWPPLRQVMARIWRRLCRITRAANKKK